MEKRIFLAIALSIAVLVGWSWLAPKLFPELAKKPVAKQTVEKTATAASTTAPATSTVAAPSTSPTADSTIAASTAAPIAAATVQTTVIDMPQYRAVLSNRGAQLVSFVLKTYMQKGTQQPVDLVKRRSPSRTDFPFAVEAADEATMKRLNGGLYAVTDVNDRGQRVVQFRYSDGKVTATKTFRFGKDPYLFDYSVTVNPPMPYRVSVGPGIRTLQPEEEDSRVHITGHGVYQREGKFKVVPREKVAMDVHPGVDYIGIEDNYFLTVLRPAHGGDGVLRRMTFIDAKDNKKRRIDVYASINAARDGIVAGTAFFGPKETELLDRYELDAALQFGWFGLIARFFLSALIWINQFTHNFGFAIIVLTILIKIVLYPLQHKSIVSMKKMQKVQPKMEAIKAKYKKARTDPEQRQKMNVEMMQLYQKEGINPAAGCLPLVLQLPILWGFYNLLSRAIELRGAPWILWIKDLSEKDPTYVLPILMTATMFLQTYLTPATGDPMQRRMFLIMPFIFGFMFKEVASGLVLYWLVQNILTILQQLIMNKWWKDHPDDDDKAK